MKWHKSPDALVQAFDHCLPTMVGVQRKAMFGYPCAFVNGHLFCGLHQDGIIVRLPEARRNRLVAKGARVFEPIPGQAMKEYVVAPAETVANRDSLRALLDEALAHATSLATKAKSSSGAKTTATTPTENAPRARKTMSIKKGPARKSVATKRAVTRKTAVRKATPSRVARSSKKSSKASPTRNARR
jgi:hypothetical protein